MSDCLLKSPSVEKETEETLKTLIDLPSPEIETTEELTMTTEGTPESASASDASGLNPNISYSGSSLYVILYAA
jgi:hypothetical protein